MAARLYLAAENRCDLNYVQLDTPEGGNKNKFLEMKNEEAEDCLRQNEVRNNCESGTMRFNDNFELRIIGNKKRMLKLMFWPHLVLVSPLLLLFCFCFLLKDISKSIVQ